MTQDKVKIPIESLAEARIAYLLMEWRDNTELIHAGELAELIVKMLKEEFNYCRIDLDKLTVISDEQVSEAIHEADCELHGTDDIEMLQPDGCWEDSIPLEIQLRHFNRAIAQKSFDDVKVQILKQMEGEK